MKEVLSVPAGESHPFIDAYHVHACPAQPRNYHYQPSHYIAFRRPGGVMSTLFAIDAVFTMLPDDTQALGEQSLSAPEKDRVRRYVAARKADWHFEEPYQPYRFYVLAETGNIALPHEPRTRSKGLRGACYFTVRELTSGHPLVDVASKAR